MYKYPFAELDDPDRLLALLGTCWSRECSAQQPLLQTIALATMLLLKQQLLSLTAAVRRACGDTAAAAPELWHQLTFVQETAGQREFALPPDFVHISLITNRISDASLILVPGYDYIIKPGSIEFMRDPVSAWPDLISRCDAAFRLWAYWTTRVDESPALLQVA